MRTKVGIPFLLLLFLSMTDAGGVFAATSPQSYYDPMRKLVIGVGGTSWNFFPGDDVSSRAALGDLKLQFVARSPKVIDQHLQPVLTMRVDEGTWRSAKHYAEKWLKEFPKFGYELQMSREAGFGTLRGYEIELTSTVSDRRIRQFIVHRPSEIWIFTCSANMKYFDETWKSCEKILKTAKAH